MAAVAPSYATDLSEGGGLLGRLAKLQGLDDEIAREGRAGGDGVYELEEGVEADGGSLGRTDETKSALEDGSLEKSFKHNDVHEYLKKKTAEEAFAEFDTDGSGAIDFDEFKAMLPQLGVKMSEAKALKYFKVCDADNSGEIGIDEFRVALYTCDPATGNTLGFAPSALLTPKDAFEMFDEDNSGAVDEDEFAFILEYLGMKVSDEKQERLFNKHVRTCAESIFHAGIFRVCAAL